jgi:outer membrane protein TolC
LIREQNRKILQTGLLPEISVSSNVNQFVQNSTVVFADNILPTSQVNGAQTYGLSAAISSNFNLMDFSQTISDLKAQRYADQASSWKNVEEKNAIIILVCKNYFDCVISQELTSAAKDKVENSEYILETSKLKLEIGEADSLEYYQTLINYEQDKNSSLIIDILYQENINNLKLLLGIESSALLSLDTNILTKSEIDFMNRSLFYSDSTMTVKVIDNELKRLKVERYSIFLNLLPQVSIFAGYGYSNQTMQNGIVEQNRALGYSYGVNVSYNIGLAKNTIHRKKVLQLEEDNLSIELNDQQLFSQNRYDLLRLELNRLIQQNASNNALLKLSERSMQNALIGYEIGTATLTDFRLSQNQYLNSRIEYKRTQSDYLICLLELLGLSNSLHEIIISKL